MKRCIFAALLFSCAVATYAQDAREAAAKIDTAVTEADLALAKPKENSIALGVTLTDGNSDTLMGTLSLMHDRKRERYNFRTGVDAAYGETEDEATTENAKAYADYRRLMDDRAYIIGNGSALYDDIADIDYRVVVSAGPGYYLMKTDKVILGVDVGPAYITEKVGGDTHDDFALRVGERYDRQLSSTAKVWQSLEYLPVMNDFEDYLLNTEIGVEAAINASVSLRLVVKNTYDSTPAADRERSDTTVVGALAYQL